MLQQLIRHDKMKSIDTFEEINYDLSPNPHAIELEPNPPLKPAFKPNPKSTLIASLNREHSHRKINYTSKSSIIESLIVDLGSKLQQKCSFDQERPLYSIQAIILIQSAFRTHLVAKHFKTLKKKALYRIQVLKELCISEANYVNDLKFIQKQIMGPVEKQNLLSQQDYQRLFVNIESIILLNDKFSEDLQQIWKYDNQFYIPLSKIIKSYIPFFKVYYDFCQHFSLEIVDQVREYNPKFDEFIKSLEYQNQLKGLNLSAFLVKPVQRLPKYVLLIKDLLKHMSQDHHDYYGTQDVLNGFKTVNHNINNMIQKYLKNSKMFELQSQFGDPNQLNILSPFREFIAEEAINVITRDTEQSVIAYIMTDLILISQRSYNSEKLFKTVHLHWNSFCKDIPDKTYYQNIFSVIGKQKSVTFSCSNKKTKRKLIQIISNLIVDLKKKYQTNNKALENYQLIDKPKLNKLIKVNVIGTQEISTVISKFTVYIIEVIVNKQRLKIFLRYSELVQLQEIISEQYKKKVDLPKLSTSNWYSNSSTKVIEMRKILIENFLQILMQSDQVMEKPDKILEFLDLPKNLYQSGEKEEMMNTDCFSVLESLDMSISLKKDEANLKTNQRYLQFLENNCYSAQELLRNSRGSHFSKTQFNNSLIALQKKESSVKKTVTITLMNLQVIKLDINEQTRCQDVIETVANQIGLQAYLDFKLMLIDQQFRVVRVLDEDETLLKIVTKYSANSKNKKTLLKEKYFDQIRNFFCNLLCNTEPQEAYLMLKKYLYLPNLQEQFDYKTDWVRLQLITYQIFEEVFQDKYHLGFHEYCLYAAFYLFIHHYTLQNQVKSSNSFPNFILNEIIPEKIKSEKPIQSWTEGVFQQLLRIREDVITVSHQIQEDLDFMSNTNFEKIEQRDKINIAQLLLINAINLTPLYGVTMFFVEFELIGAELDQYYQANRKKFPNQIYLGISYQQIMVIDPFQYSCLLTYPIVDIEDQRYYTTKIEWKIKNIQHTFQFQTKQVYQIKSLMKEYEQIHQLQNEIRQSGQQLKENLKDSFNEDESNSSIQQMQRLKKTSYQL